MEPHWRKPRHIVYFDRQGVRVTDSDLIVDGQQYSIHDIRPVGTRSRIVYRTAAVVSAVALTEAAAISVVWQITPKSLVQFLLAFVVGFSSAGLLIMYRLWPRSHEVWVRSGRRRVCVYVTRERWLALQLTRAIRRAAAEVEHRRVWNPAPRR